MGTGSGGNDTWTITSSNLSIANSYCFYIPEMTNYINHQQQDGVHCLKYWDGRDEGSSVTFYAPASFVISALQDALQTWESAPQGAVGYPAALDANQLQATIGNLQGNPFDFDAAKAGAELIPETVQLTEGYYRIYNALEGLYSNSKGIYFDGDSFVWGSIDNQHVDHIVKVVPSANQEGKWCLIAPNYNRYMQGVAGAIN